MLKRPWVWVVFSMLSLLATLVLHLSHQLGDPGWWPREAEAYNRAHAIPDEENAAPLYQAIIIPIPQWMQLEATLNSDWRLPVAASDIAGFDWRSPALDAATEASRKPAWWPPFDPHHDLYNQPYGILSVMKGVGNALVFKARIEAGGGHLEQAMETLMTDFRMSFQLDHGTLMDLLVAVAIRRSAWQYMPKLLMDAPPSAETLEHMAAEFQALAPRRPSLYREPDRVTNRGGLEETYSPSGFARMLASDRGWPPRPPSRSEIWKGTGLWLWVAITQPIARCRRELDEVNGLLSKQDPTPQELARLNALASTGTFWTQRNLPAYRKCRSALSEDWMRVCLTRTLLLIQAYRLRNGRYPESLDALRRSTALEIPDDPRTGKPFDYTPMEGDGFTLGGTPYGRTPMPAETK